MIEKGTRGRPESEKLTIVVVCKRSKIGKKHFMYCFEGIELDLILNSAIKKPLIPNEMEIIDLVIGKSFIEKYKKQYKIK
jgi:hypothetical protein